MRPIILDQNGVVSGTNSLDYSLFLPYFLEMFAVKLEKKTLVISFEDSFGAVGNLARNFGCKFEKLGKQGTLLFVIVIKIIIG